MAQPTLIDEHRMRFDYVKSVRARHDNDWQNIMDLILPFVGDIHQARNDEGGRRIPGVFDTTGVTSADLLLNFVVSQMIPIGNPWVGIETTPELMEDIQIKQLMESASREYLDLLSQTNYYVQFPSTVINWLILGNACISQHTKNNETIVFDNRPMGDTWWQIGPDREPNFIYHQKAVPVLDALRFFIRTKEIKQSQLPRKLVEMSEGIRKLEKVQIVHAVYENENGLPNAIKTPREKRWLSDWMIWGDNGLEMVSATEGFDLSPYTCARMMTVNGEDYGRGRGHIARPDLMRLNRIKHMSLLSLTRELLPTLLVEDQSVVQLTGRPGGIAIFRPNAAPPQFLRPGSDHLQADSIANLEREQVKKGLLVDVLEDKETQTRSATEAARQDRKALQRLHSPTNSLRKELIEPQTLSSISNFRSIGKLKQLQEAANKANVKDIPIRIVLKSPFFSAQNQPTLQLVEAWTDTQVRRAVELQQPELMDRVNLDEVAKTEASLAEIPANLLNTDEEVNRLREDRQEANLRAEAREEAQVEAALNRTAQQNAGQPTANAV